MLLHGLTNTYEPDILILSETWCNTNNVSNFVIHGYTHANYFIRKQMIHGGVSIFVNSKLNFNKCDAIDKLACEYHFELTGIEIDCKFEKLRVIGIYRAGKGAFKIMTDVFNKLFNLLGTLPKRKTVLLGDWNVDFLSDSIERKTLNDIMIPNGYQNIVNFETRIDKDRSRTSIDFVVTNILIPEIFVTPIATGLSDHDAQIATVDTHRHRLPKYKYVEKRIFNNSKIEDFMNAMLSYDWDTIFAIYNDKTVENFINKLTWNMDVYFPKKVTRTKTVRKCPWICDEIVKAQQDIHDLYQLQRQYPNLLSISCLIGRKVENHNASIERKKKEYVGQRIQKSKNPKKEVWAIIKEDTNQAVKDWKWDILDATSNRKILIENIPDHINSHFISIGHDIVRSNRPNLIKSLSFLKKTTSHQPTFNFECISKEYLIKLAKVKIQNSHTKDLFDISGNFLYQILTSLGDHILFLINNILESNYYPESLKKSRLTPLYKGKGEVSDVKNYRPITIVPTISKLVESVMSESIMKHLQSNQILSNCQHAYRTSRSTISATQTFLRCVTQCLERKKKVAGIFLDLSKAFDSVNHELLLEKLKVYGVRGRSLELLGSFLDHREQTVEIKCNDKRLRSKPEFINIGVPQGSSLGNTLFLIFLNDMASNNILGDIVQYADDTTVIIAADNIPDLLKNIGDTIQILADWFTMNGLKLNEDKTCVMIFNAKATNKSTTFTVPLQSGSTINSSNLTKLLGFELDPGLTWKHHIDTTCQKMARGIYALKQIRPITTEQNLKETYYAYVHSIMTYGIIMWGWSTDCERVLKMQKRAIRTLVKAKYKDSCRDLFKKLHILTSTSVYIFEILKYVKHNMDQYKIRGANSNRRARNGICLESVTYRLNLSKKQPQVIGPKLFNKLPLCVRQIECVNSFLQNVKLLLLDKTIYNVSEFLGNDYSTFNIDFENND